MMKVKFQHDEDYDGSGEPDRSHFLSSNAVEKFSRLLNRIDNIDPFVRFRKLALMRAFVVWSRSSALVRKCNELKRQLQERLMIFQSLHDCYLKDVIAVNHHLLIISDLVNEHLQHEMYETKSIPLTTIRSVITRAKEIPQETSVQLKETLINAGLIDRTRGMHLT